jgi:Glycogen recognition site of AMP-activated protein kinase
MPSGTHVFSITVDAEPGGHRFRFVVDGESRTSPEYKLATDHQNVVVNYLDHMKHEMDPDAKSHQSFVALPDHGIPCLKTEADIRIYQETS